VKAAESTLRSLNWLNFSIAAMQAGFGPFISVRLTDSGWTPGAIGFALSAGTIASIVAQVPSGAVIDWFGTPRGLAAPAILCLMLALTLLALAPAHPLVFMAELIQGGAGVGLSLAVAAITLCVSRQEYLGERFGHNVRYAAVGAAFGTGVLGVVGTGISPAAVFLIAAVFGLPALAALHGISGADLATAHRRTSHHTAPPPAARRSRPVPARRLLADRRLLALLACAALFQLANASLLPLAATRFPHALGRRADLVTAVAIVLPQLIAAGLSPRLGAAAGQHGRRLLLMAGLVPVPLRAVGFALDDGVPAILALQALDGITSAAIGVLMPLIVADITHRGGRFNFALGLTGLAGSVGATLSTAASGSLADHAGLPVAFLALAAAALAAILVVWAFLPETAHLPAALRVASNGNHSR